MVNALEVTIDEMGRVLIPTAIREQTNLQAGDKLTIYPHGDAVIILRPDEKDE